jgi:hypothetical protein
MGLGFAWFPEETVRGELEGGLLKPLPLREGGERWGNLYLVFADRDYAGPGALRLAQIIRKHVAEQATKKQVNANNASVGVRWIQSYANADETKTFCIYEGPSEAAVRKAAELNKLPVDSIMEVPVTLRPR